MQFEISELLNHSPEKIIINSGTGVGSIYAYSTVDGCIVAAYNSVSGRSWDGDNLDLLNSLAMVTQHEDYVFIVSLVDDYTLSTAIVKDGNAFTGNTSKAIEQIALFIQAAKYETNNPVNNGVIGLDPEPLVALYHRRIEAAEKIGHELARLDYIDVTDRLAAVAR